MTREKILGPFGSAYLGAVNPLLPQDPNTRASLESRRKLLTALVQAGPNGLGRREWARKAKVAGSTLSSHLQEFLEKQAVVRDEKHRYVFNKKKRAPITLEELRVGRTPRPPGGGPYAFFRHSRGRTELTEWAKRNLTRLKDGLNEKDRRSRSLEQFLDRMVWDGIRANFIVDVLGAQSEDQATLVIAG